MQLVQEKAKKYNENGYKLASVICRQFLIIAKAPEDVKGAFSLS